MDAWGTNYPQNIWNIHEQPQNAWNTYEQLQNTSNTYEQPVIYRDEIQAHMSVLDIPLVTITFQVSFPFYLAFVWSSF